MAQKDNAFDVREWEIERLKRNNEYLMLFCGALLIVVFFLADRIRQPHFIIYDDSSLGYSPALFAKVDTSLACYYSADSEQWVIGRENKINNKWEDIVWLEGPRRYRNLEKDPKLEQFFQRLDRLSNPQ